MDDLIDRQALLRDIEKYHLSDGKFQHWIEVQPSAQRWIPCSERLPEHGGRYLISVLDGIDRRTTIAPYLPRCKAWSMTGRMAYWKVIAWMELPKAYCGADMREKNDG